MVAVWVSLYVFSYVVVILQFMWELPQSPLFLRALRLVGSLNSTVSACPVCTRVQRALGIATCAQSTNRFHSMPQVLFLPVSALLLRSIRCGSNNGSWMGSSSMACGGGSHITLVVFNFTLLAIFCAISLVVATTGVDRSPVSASWQARVNGRLDVAVLAAKLALAVLANALSSPAFDASWIAVLATLGIALLCLSAIYVYQPYVHAEANAVVCAQFAAFAFATSCAAVAQAGGSQQDWSAMTIVGTCLAAILGYVLSMQRDASICSSPLKDLSAMHELHMWSRHQMQIAAGTIQGPPSAAGAIDYSSESNDEVADSRATASLVTPATRTTRRSLPGAGDASPSSGFRPRLRPSLNPRLLALHLARRGYRLLRERFPRSPTALIMCSVFHAQCQPSFRAMEAQLLCIALQQQPPVDQEFYIRQRVAVLRESISSRSGRQAAGGSSGSSGSVGGAAVNPGSSGRLSSIDRILVEQKQREIATLQIETKRAALQLWDVV